MSCFGHVSRHEIQMLPCPCPCPCPCTLRPALLHVSQQSSWIQSRASRAPEMRGQPRAQTIDHNTMLYCVLCQTISHHPFSYNSNSNTRFTSSMCLFPAPLYPPLSRFSRDFPLYPLPQNLSPSSLLPGCNATSPSGAPSEDLEGHRHPQRKPVPLQQPNSSAQHPLRPLQQQSPLPKPAKVPP